MPAASHFGLSTPLILKAIVVYEIKGKRENYVNIFTHFLHANIINLSLTVVSRLLPMYVHF